ncbi:nucleotidyl transferase AbiEii/AbiGii toxin family protein [Piscinibacter sp.]|uniref:nucleotidyl transferase AbiEii/AbiGii toxin family protein n=1 Tax=Piscinibacter sp. TaxID=1903157 RepID=UPI0025F47F2E|nr:nucleotidyl transferase AbiEii/AbiGii toxin family protein [Piscinibacter sp.]
MGMTTDVVRRQPARLPEGPWRALLAQAFLLIDELSTRGLSDPFWTLGGGTVLMFRYRHRRSKDIDIFVPDPQYLGHVTPRLSDLAETIAPDYVEGAGYVKLLRPEGEIDFVASPNLTDMPYERWRVLRRQVRVETATEIIAKKLWHRGDTLSARDLFDLSLVIEREPDALRQAHRFLTRHRHALIDQLHSRSDVLRAQFEAIDTLQYRPTFDEAAARATGFLQGFPGPAGP